MSIRKVSDLQGLSFTDPNVTEDDIKNSLLELSFPEQENGFHAYKSVYTTYDNVKTNILSAILSSGNTVNFYDTVNFTSTVYFLDGVHISGDFFLNISSDDQTVSDNDWTTHMKNNNQYFTSLVTNYLSAGQSNIFQSPLNIICSDIQTLATFSDEFIKFENAKKFIINNPETYLGGNLCCLGDAYFQNVIQGTSLRALWADLAEKYEADAQYSPGTLIRFGGPREITIACDGIANGVVSTKPGITLGSDFDNEGSTWPNLVEVALVGRVPVKTVGNVRKFDRLVLSHSPGCAETALQANESKVIGIALEDKTLSSDLVECVVNLKLI